MSITREEAHERAHKVYRETECIAEMVDGMADALLRLQAETERRVVEKCCEIAERLYNTRGGNLSYYFREAFPERKEQ